jgi:hypothetical protein
MWTETKGVPAGSRKKANQMLNQVQHDNGIGFSLFVIPNQVLKQVQDLSSSGSRLYSKEA